MKDKIKRRIPLLDLKHQYEIFGDEETPESIRRTVVLSLLFSGLYFIVPVDVIPDIILGLGYLDDLALYAFLREIVYTGHEKNLGFKASLFSTLKSRVAVAVSSAVFVLLLLTGLVSYFVFV